MDQELTALIKENLNLLITGFLIISSSFAVLMMVRNPSQPLESAATENELYNEHLKEYQAEFK